MSFTVSPENYMAFKILLENIGDINNQVNITLYNSHLYIQGMDPCHVCLFELKLDKSWFQQYDVVDSITVGLNITVVNKIISCCGKSQSIQFVVKDKSDKITINLIGGKGSDIDKSFETNIYDYDVELLQITDIDSDIDISIKSHLLSSLVEQIAVFGDTLRFECADNGITLISKENKLDTEMKCNIPIDRISAYSTTDEAVFNEYSILYYSKMCKYAKLMDKDANVEIQIAKDVPLIMKYKLSQDDANEKDAYDCDTDDEEGAGCTKIDSVMMLCLAPKVPDEDLNNN